MWRKGLLVACLPWLMCASAAAQQWAEKMFPVRTHDFGTVARGAKAEFFFKLKNLYKEDIHIAAVRTSCGCTTPQITKPTLKTFEEGSIIAQYNTTRFLGSKTATLTVVIDKPYYAEVQLRVQGYIRSDVVLRPSSLQYGSVEEGSSTSRRMRVHYAGRADWKITGVKSPHPYIEAHAEEVSRLGKEVQYDLVVTLKPDAPAGYVRESLTVLTNDHSQGSFLVELEGRVQSEISVSPATLFLGVLKPGQTVTKKVVVRGKKPFKIMKAKCGDEHFKLQLPEVAKKLHLIPVTFTAGDKPGAITGKICICTDLGEEVTTELSVHAQVTAP